MLVREVSVLCLCERTSSLEDGDVFILFTCVMHNGLRFSFGPRVGVGPKRLALSGQDWHELVDWSI